MEIKQVNKASVVMIPDTDEGVFVSAPYTGEITSVAIATRYAGNELVISGIKNANHLERLKAGDVAVLAEEGYVAPDQDRPNVTTFNNCEGWLRQDGDHVAHLPRGVIEYMLSEQ